MSDPTCTSEQKKEIIQKTTGKRPCFMCLEGIPSVELSYKAGNAHVIEYYCQSCLNKVFSRESLEPKNMEGIPGYYNCVKVDQIPHSNPTL